MNVFLIKNNFYESFFVKNIRIIFKQTAICIAESIKNISNPLVFELHAQWRNIY